MIAREAGVSNATVSIVLSGDPRKQISSQTRDRVLSIARDLGYMAPLLAHTSVTRTGNIGYLLEARAAEQLQENNYLANFRQGMLDASAAYECDLLVSTCNVTDELPALVTQKKVDGLVVDAMAPEAWFQALSAHVPIVLANGYPGAHPAFDRVYLDSAVGVREAVQALATLGHRRIALFGLGGRSNDYLRARAESFRATAAHLGLPDASACEVLPEAQTRTFDEILVVARQAFALWQAQPEPPTAVFALNDLYALGLCKVARELGVEIPRELSVVGFDNYFAGQCYHPSLSTIDHRADLVSRTAVSLLMSRLDDPDQPPRSVTITPELCLRESVAPPAR
jgi:DNA-binding LacI/PurR family transcriptional regulator